jgi:hypothetical protein
VAEVCVDKKPPSGCDLLATSDDLTNFNGKCRDAPGCIEISNSGAEYNKCSEKKEKCSSLSDLFSNNLQKCITNEGCTWKDALQETEACYRTADPLCVNRLILIPPHIRPVEKFILSECLDRKCSWRKPAHPYCVNNNIDPRCSKEILPTVIHFNEGECRARGCTWGYGGTCKFEGDCPKNICVPKEEDKDKCDDLRLDNDKDDCENSDCQWNAVCKDVAGRCSPKSSPKIPPGLSANN